MGCGEGGLFLSYPPKFQFQYLLYLLRIIHWITLQRLAPQNPTTPKPVLSIDPLKKSLRHEFDIPSLPPPPKKTLEPSPHYRKSHLPLVFSQNIICFVCIGSSGPNLFTGSSISGFGLLEVGFRIRG